MVDNETLRDRFIAARTACGWSIRRLAQWYGVDQKTLWAYEAGQTPFPDDALVRWLEGVASYLQRHPIPQRWT